MTSSTSPTGNSIALLEDRLLSAVYAATGIQLATVQHAIELNGQPLLRFQQFAAELLPHLKCEPIRISLCQSFGRIGPEAFDLAHKIYESEKNESVRSLLEKAMINSGASPSRLVELFSRSVLPLGLEGALFILKRAKGKSLDSLFSASSFSKDALWFISLKHAKLYDSTLGPNGSIARSEDSLSSANCREFIESCQRNGFMAGEYPFAMPFGGRIRLLPGAVNPGKLKYMSQAEFKAVFLNSNPEAFANKLIFLQNNLEVLDWRFLPDSIYIAVRLGLNDESRIGAISLPYSSLNL